MDGGCEQGWSERRKNVTDNGVGVNMGKPAAQIRGGGYKARSCTGEACGANPWREAGVCTVEARTSWTHLVARSAPRWNLNVGTP